MPKPVVLLGNPMRKRARCAAGPIYPGELIQRDPQGEVRRHAFRGARTPALYAIENQVGGGIDTPYATGDEVGYVVARPGDEINARVAPFAHAIVAEDRLVSNGAGGVEWDNRWQDLDDEIDDEPFGYALPNGKHAGSIGRALEALDNSNSGVAARLRIEVTECE